MAKMFTIKPNVATVIAVAVSLLVLFFDAASVAAFNAHGKPPGPRIAFNGKAGPGNGSPSGPPGNRHGQRFYRADPGPGNYRSAPRPGNYQGGRGPGHFGNGPAPRFYRGQPFSPYGGPWMGGYGERRVVQSKGDAQRMLNDYYLRRNMRIGPITEGRFYFQADILDKNNRFIDRVIIDKRSGRIRSIY